MNQPCSIPTDLARAAGVLPLEWLEEGDRALSAATVSLLQSLGEGTRIDAGGTVTCLDDYLAPLGVQRLAHCLASAAAATDDSSGVIDSVRVPTRLATEETQHLSANDLVWWELTIRWSRTDDGPLHCSALAKDVSLSVAMEREAKVQKERYDLAVDGSRLGTWDWDPSTGMLTINQHWIEMLGETFGTSSLSVESWEERVHPDDVEGAYADLQAHMRGETDFYENTYRLRHADGHWVYILDRGRVVERNADGEVTRFSGTHTDITSQKEAELAAQEATKAKSLFLATMSHEIRTPLHGILGMLQVLEGTDLSADQIEALGVAATSGEHLLVLVNDILEISKIEAGQFQLDPQPFEFAQWIHSVADLFRPRAEEKDLILDVAVSMSTPSWLVADDHRLRQVVGNLISNAVKFTDEGSVRIETNHEDQTGFLTVRVTDTGKGIEDTERIWNRFSQEDASISRQFGGTGLGLSLSRQIVELMGGFISVESTPGSGSSFVFSVPAQATVAPASAKASADSSTEVNVEDIAVLVAEDNPVNRRVAKGIFRRLGMEVEFAEDGVVALERCRESNYDVVFMDLHMPRMDGIEATRSILEEHGEGAPTVVALTADLTEEARAGCVEAGVSHFLTKPFRLAELEEIL
ncbi:MAG: ATP-binding protein, partial [Planctomycetota bacterium]